MLHLKKENMVMISGISQSLKLIRTNVMISGISQSLKLIRTNVMDSGISQSLTNFKTRKGILRYYCT